MSCPVVRTIKELYGAYDYGEQEQENATLSAPHSQTSMLVPSGISGGGSSSTDISMETMQFYITMRRLQFARAELIAQDRSQQNIQQSDDTDITHALTDESVHTSESKPTHIPTSAHTTEKPKTYFDRMFKDYLGKKSGALFKEIFGASAKKIYTAITRSIDLIDIMESICSGSLARDFPSGMSLPTVCFDPSAIEVIELQPSCVYSEVNKIIDYANNLCVGGIRTKIDPLPKFDKILRDFTFQSNDTADTADTADTDSARGMISKYKKMLDLDMEIAEYGMTLEQYHCDAIKKLNEVMMLCQSIIDLAKPQ